MFLNRIYSKLMCYCALCLTGQIVELIVGRVFKQLVSFCKCFTVREFVL